VAVAAPSSDDHPAENSGFVNGTPSDSDDDDYDDDDSEYEDDIVFKKQRHECPSVVKSKSKLSQALSDSKSLPLLTKRFIKRHHYKLVAAVAVYAFRKEIMSLLWKGVSVPVVDPQSGRVVGRGIYVSPSRILKLALFIYILVRMQQQPSPSTVLLLGTLTGNGSLAMILNRLLTPSPAFLPSIEQHYTFEKLNDRYKRDQMALSRALGTSSITTFTGRQPEAIKSATNSTNMTITEMLLRNARKFSSHSESTTSYNGTLVVLDWTNLDSGMSRMHILRDQVSFLVSLIPDTATTKSNVPGAAPNSSAVTEVVVVLESPGGSAADYALAAQQLLRLRHVGIPVTVCVDKVAASGGYMIACTASSGRLFAAPFAVVGSIGVLGSTINIHKTLEGWGVQPLVFRGGKDKAPVGLIGEITQEGVAKVQHMVDDTHRAFKSHVANSRPIIANRIEELATGDTWIGYDALQEGLIDRIITSDEYLTQRIQEGARVLKLHKLVKGSLFGRPTTSSGGSLNTRQDSQKDSSFWFAFLTDFHSLLEQASSVLKKFIVLDGLHVAARLSHPIVEHQATSSNL
jgi:serine protease SohB